MAKCTEQFSANFNLAFLNGGLQQGFAQLRDDESVYNGCWHFCCNINRPLLQTNQITLGRGSGDNLDKVLQSRLFTKVLSWDLDSKPSYSGASSTLTKDIENIIELVTNSTVSTLVGIPFIVINTLVIYLIAGPVALVVVLVCAITLAHSIFSISELRVLAQKTKTTKSRKQVFIWKL